MCGFAGIASRLPRSGEVLDEMLKAIRHRGPDGSGKAYISASGEVVRSDAEWTFALSHTRLALVGSAGAGMQPSCNASGTVHCVVNGEIYNHAELRKRFLHRGQLPGDCDCDVIPYLAENAGTRGLAAMSGIYSGAVVDVRDRSVTLFRDRLGARPLYYLVHRGDLIFASEIKSLLAVDGITCEVNERALVEYFTYQSPLDDRTLFSGVHTVRPGHWLRYAEGVLTTGSLWSKPSPEPPTSFQGAVEHLRELIGSAIERQIHPKAGAYLSSGIDTNCIVSSLSSRIPGLVAYTATFEASEIDRLDAGCDESIAAAELARSYEVAHEAVALTAVDFREEFPRMIAHLEDLRMPMAFGSWKVAQHASARHSVLYSGMGSDELFAGYTNRLKLLPGDDVGEAQWLIAYEAMWGRRLVSRDARSTAFVGSVQSLARCIDPSAYFREVLASNLMIDGAGAVRRLLTVEQSYFLPGLLVVDDRMSMAYGVETRVPLIDQQIFDFSLTLPDRYLYSGGIGKAILRAAINDRVPPSVYTQPKQSFRVPEGSWYRGALSDWVRSSLLGPTARSSEYLSRAFVAQAINEHARASPDRRHLIWSLLSFEYWCRLFLR